MLPRTAKTEVKLMNFPAPRLAVHLHLMVLFTALPLYRMAGGETREGLPDHTAWSITASVDWRDGFTDAVTVQANPNGIVIVPDPDAISGRVIRAKIERDERFTSIVNGTPRAEVLIREPATFIQGKEYLVRWSTFIPKEFEFDYKQLVIISQIHQGTLAGGPTVALTVLGESYFISTRGGAQLKSTTAGAKICCAETDKGKWVQWTLRYIPDDSGRYSLTQLWKGDDSVFRSEHVANAYPGDNSAYMKVGLYKAGWKREPSDVKTVTMLFGPISIRAHERAPI